MSDLGKAAAPRPMSEERDEYAEIQVAEENLGTIVVSEKETDPRKALRPVPSLDPNDPLNWSPWEKYTTLAVICFYSFLATVNASNLSVAVVPLTKYFHKSSTEITYLLCFNTLMLGLGNLVWVPLMRTFGKRPVYLVAMFLFVMFNIWSYEAKSYRSLLAARMLSGLAASAGDAPVPAVVADLFFVHERGFCLMLCQIGLSFGFFLGPLINAYVVEDTRSWQWACGWLAIAGGVTWLIAIFALHETSYPHRQIDAPAETYGPKRGFWAQKAINISYNKNASLFKTILDICEISLYPPVVWAGITTGVFVGWNIVIQLNSAVIFTKPPYLWHIHSLGLLALAGLVGTILAIFIGGKLIDIIANRWTARNHGRREPEYRLPAVIVPAIIGPMGVLIFGLCIANKTSWVGPAFGYGMQGFGLTAVSNVLVTYAVDSYSTRPGEALVFFFIIRAVFGCLLSLFTFDWIKATGTANAFGQMVGIQYFVLLFAILFFFKGKQIRRWTTKFGPLKHQSQAVAPAGPMHS